MSPFTTQKMAKPMMMKLMMALMNRPKLRVGRAGMLGIGECGVVLAVQAHEHVREIDAADQEPEQRVDHVLHQAVHHAGEGGADDDADGEIDDAAAHDEGAEFAYP